ncbi:hypothetical protein KI387_006653, partial [Taxus chinensis]
MAGRYGPERYREIHRLVCRAFQDADTRAGHLETVSGISDMGQSGCSPGGIEMEQG